MTKSLEEIRDRLEKAFDTAATNLESAQSIGSGSSTERSSARSLALQALAQTGESLIQAQNAVTFAELLARAEKDGSQIVLEINQGLDKNVKPLASIKLKQPGKP